MESYIHKAFLELNKEDGLTIMCRGAGLHRLLVRFIQFYSFGTEVLHQSQEEQRKLVFVINVKDEEQGGGRNKSGDEQKIIDSLISDGVPPNRLPILLNAKSTSVGDRREMYHNGGCFICTSRILIVDLLDGKLDPRQIHGILVPDAHEVTEGGVESFILRKFRSLINRGLLRHLVTNQKSSRANLVKLSVS